MNTYVYAPKDDMKHRALWRQLYSAEEEGKSFNLMHAILLIIAGNFYSHLACIIVKIYSTYIPL